MTNKAHHRKAVAISPLVCPNPTAFRREFHRTYGVPCPEGKVFPTLKAASLALGYRPGTLRTLRSQNGGASVMGLRGLTINFLQ